MNEERLGRDKWRIVGKGWMTKGWEGMNEWIKNSNRRMTEWKLEINTKVRHVSTTKK